VFRVGVDNLIRQMRTTLYLNVPVLSIAQSETYKYKNKSNVPETPKQTPR